MTPHQRLVDSLEANGSRRNGRDWQCPAHHDRTPSLTVTKAENGTVLLHCHAGCTVEDVVRALGLEISDLFPAQTRLFKAERYAPIGVAVYLALPASSARSFAVTAACGRFRHRDGTFRRGSKGVSYVASILKPKDREAAMGLLGIKDRAFRNLTMEWRSDGVAHSCKRGMLALFLREPSERCPVCDRPTSWISAVQAPSKSWITAASPSRTSWISAAPRHEPGTTPKTGSPRKVENEPYDGVKALEFLKIDEARRSGSKIALERGGTA